MDLNSEGISAANEVFRIDFSREKHLLFQSGNIACREGLRVDPPHGQIHTMNFLPVQIDDSAVIALEAEHDGSYRVGIEHIEDATKVGCDVTPLGRTSFDRGAGVPTEAQICCPKLPFGVIKVSRNPLSWGGRALIEIT